MLQKGFSELLCIMWIIIIEIVIVGLLWVLRVAIDWWLDIDYVVKIKEWIKKNERNI